MRSRGPRPLVRLRPAQRPADQDRDGLPLVPGVGERFGDGRGVLLGGGAARMAEQLGPSAGSAPISDRSAARARTGRSAALTSPIRASLITPSRTVSVAETATVAKQKCVRRCSMKPTRCRRRAAGSAPT